jgi:mannosyltransferase
LQSSAEFSQEPGRSADRDVSATGQHIRDLEQIASSSQVQTSDTIGKDEVDRSPSSPAEKIKRPAWMQWFLQSGPANWLLCIIVAGIALGFDLYRLGTPSLWFDETFSVELARQPLPVLWHTIFGLEPNMELYYLLLHFWLNFTSFLGLHPTEFVVRFPSTIFATMSSVLVFLLGRRYFGIIAGFAAAVLYTLARLQLTYAQQTRAYSLQLLLLCLAWYALLVALSTGNRQRRWWICYIVAMTLAIYTQLFSFIVLLAQICAYGVLLVLPGPWRDNVRRQFLTFVISLTVAGVLVIPMALVSLYGGKQAAGWLPIPHLHDIVVLFIIISGDSKNYLFALAICAFWGLVVAALVYLPDGLSLLRPIALTQQRRDERLLQLQRFLPVAAVLLCWLVVPVVVSYILSQGQTRLFSTRTLIVVLPPFFLLAGLGIATLRWRSLQVVLVLLLLLFFAGRYVQGYYAGAQVEDWRSAAQWLQQHYQAGDGLVCYNNIQGCQTAMEYYFFAYPGAAHFTSDSPGSNVLDANDPFYPNRNYKAALDPQALAKFGAKHAHLFFIIGRLTNTDDVGVQAAQHWLDAHYHLVGQVATKGVTVRLYSTGFGPGGAIVNDVGSVLPLYAIEYIPRVNNTIPTPSKMAKVLQMKLCRHAYS